MGWVTLGNETPRSTILLIESSTTCAVKSLLTHSSGNLVLSIRIAAWLNGITNAQNLVALQKDFCNAGCAEVYQAATLLF